jgi:ABC-type branched-subunit amino acid transport system ATPase component
VSAFFEVRDLTVSFGPVMVVSEVSFTLDRGSILGVIGPNGAGKTTVFDAISGFVPARGRITLDGAELAGMTPEGRSRRGLGRSFQDARLFPSLTVAEALAVAFERHIAAQDVVSTGLRLPWVARAERHVRAKVEDLIELMGLGAFRDKFVSELSTGSRRIVDLAVIMAHDPKVLLLDEPSSGIAQRETEALGPLLLRLRDETGASLIVVEHDMPLVRAVSDELLALETGMVLTRGKPEEVLDDPRLIAAYLGTDQAAIARSGTRAETNGSSSNGSRPRKRQPARAAASKKAAQEAPSTTSTAKKAAAKKAAPKKATAKKATAKKATVKKATVKKATVKKATVKKATAKKATAKKAPPKKATAKKATAKKATAAR